MKKLTFTIMIVLGLVTVMNSCTAAAIDEESMLLEVLEVEAVGGDLWSPGIDESEH